MGSSKTTARMQRIGTETAFETAARAAALEASGQDIIHLELGEPDFETPLHIRAAAKAALDAGETHYGPYRGLPELRRAIVDIDAARRGLDVDPDQVFVTVGAKAVIGYTVAATVEPRDEVIVPDPGFPIYASMVEFAGARALPIPMRQRYGFRLDVEELSSLITPRTRLLVLNSPSNPTGGVLGQHDLERIAELALRHDLVVLSDEIYSRLLYGGESHVSIASLPGMAERTIVLDGFSKTYAMTGWRLGYAIVPRWLESAFGKLIINTVSCAPPFIQRAAIEALRGPQEPLDRMLAEFGSRRDLTVDRLDSIPGIECLRPAGAFYAFPDVSGTGLSGDSLAERLLTEAGVCVLSGSAFGSVATNHIRISYATSREKLTAAMDRIEESVRALDGAGERPAPGITAA